MSKATPGPWRYQEASDVYTHIVRGPNNYFVCQFSQDTSGRSEADARLTAAAPELLNALKDAKSHYGEECGCGNCYECVLWTIAGVAIQKAEGQL